MLFGLTLPLPTHVAHALDVDLEKAKIAKNIPGQGKVDFHALRTAYTTLVIESGANLKEAQTLLRHSHLGDRNLTVLDIQVNWPKAA